MCCREYRLSQRQKHFRNVVYGTVQRMYPLFNNYYVILGCKGLNLGHAILSNLISFPGNSSNFASIYFLYLDTSMQSKPHAPTF